MVNVFRLKPASTECQWVCPAEKTAFKTKQYWFDSSSKLKSWDNPQFYVQNPLKHRSNFFMGLSGALIFDQAVMNDYVVRTHLELAGEILPIQLETGEPLFVLNVTEIANALNHNLSVFRKMPGSDEPSGVLEYVFWPDRMVQSCIFKIPETAPIDVLAVSGRFKSPEDDFYLAYQQSGLTGLKFDQIWREG